MGAIDMLLTNPDSIMKGFETLLGKKHYLVVHDKESRDLICFFYDIDAGKALIETYLRKNNIEKNSIDITKVTLKNKSEELNIMLPKKLVILDKRITTYDEVINLAKSIEIKGYTEGKLKHTVNQFSSL